MIGVDFMMFLGSEMKTNGLVESAVHKLVLLHIFEVRSPPRGLKFTHKLSQDIKNYTEG